MANICETKIGNGVISTYFGSSFFHEISISNANGSESSIHLKFSKGENKNSITFGKNEYISEVEYDCDCIPIYLQFKTNRGRSIEAGDNSYGDDIQKLENIRLLAIRGGNDEYDRVGSLTLTYISNYQPSECVKSNQSFILSFSPHFGEFEEITDPFEKNLDCFQNIMAHMMNRTLTVGVETEFVLKVSSSLEMDMGEGDLNDFNGLASYRITTLKKKLESGNQSQSGEMQAGQNRKSSRKTIKVPEGYVAIKVVDGDLMQGEGGISWMFPTSMATYCILKLDEAEAMLGHYDLTSQLYKQMPKLKNYKTISEGYVYYADPV